MINWHNILLSNYDFTVFFTGIAPDSIHEYEQGDNTEQERKLVREKLVTFYETNISTRLKADLCSLEVGNHNHAKEASTSKLCKKILI